MADPEPHVSDQDGPFPEPHTDPVEALHADTCQMEGLSPDQF